jgi:hypothetical protein
MFAFLTPLLSFLGGPVITGLIGAYKAKLDAGNTAENIAADLAARELAVQQREIEVEGQLKVAEIGRWYEPDHLFGYIMVIYFGKIVLWDKVFASLTNGNTDPIAGDAGQWAGWIMTFYVGMRGFQNVARIIKR